MARFHGKRAASLRDSGCDVIAFETVPVAAEAEAIAKALDETVRHPAWISFSCASASTLCSGEPLAEGVRKALKSPHVVGVGINCSRPEYCASLLAIARAEVERASATVTVGREDKGEGRVVRLLVYPNSGEDWDAERRCWVIATRDSSDGSGAAAAGETRAACDGKSLADMVPDWMAQGATLIGGCCRVGPDDIRAIAEKVGW